MTRILKTLGLTAIAALATGAMLASAAQAVETTNLGVFNAGTTPNTPKPATIVGEQEEDPAGKEDFFKVDTEKADTVTCDTAFFNGTDAEGTAKELTIEAEYIHCQAIQGEDVNAATVDMNGCDYIFRQPTKLADDEYTGKAALTCPHEEKIEIKVFGFGTSTNTNHFGLGCTIKVWPNAATTHEGTTHRVQELSGHILYKEFANADVTEDETLRDDITVTANVTSITSEQSGLGCASEENENGEYQNVVTMWALNDDEKEHNEHLDAWISDEVVTHE